MSDIGKEELHAYFGDVSGYSIGQRQRHFFFQSSGRLSPETPSDVILWNDAWKTAMEEITHENHTMLRLICMKLGIE